ncbi:hypothetical protein Slin15195_G120340 [Septoria linicola]|uniref:Uncharacterized protein n=1 Tax=Septoria linicola TaxID=215465 RepID=A0A9Q9B136_9PEZI|nr:hypothetical protein Slin15195_G120340 [Septoria linicola]
MPQRLVCTRKEGFVTFSQAKSHGGVDGPLRFRLWLHLDKAYLSMRVINDDGAERTLEICLDDCYGISIHSGVLYDKQGELSVERISSHYVQKLGYTPPPNEYQGSNARIINGMRATPFYAEKNYRFLDIRLVSIEHAEWSGAPLDTLSGSCQQIVTEFKEYRNLDCLITIDFRERFPALAPYIYACEQAQEERERMARAEVVGSGDDDDNDDGGADEVPQTTVQDTPAYQNLGEMFEGSIDEASRGTWEGAKVGKACSMSRQDV